MNFVESPVDESSLNGYMLDNTFSRMCTDYPAEIMVVQVKVKTVYA